MRIAIYDNDFSSATTLKSMLYDFSNSFNLDFVVDIFKSFNKQLKPEREYTLIFISFKNDDDIKKAEAFYKNNTKTPLIIYSNDFSHTTAAFKIHAYNFLHSPFKREQLFEILEDFFINSPSAPLIIRNNREAICINTNNIFYVEADKKHCNIHMTDYTFNCNKTMAKVSAVLPQERFLKISRSFIVNSDYVMCFCSKYIILTNDVILYPSRHFYKAFKSDYLRIKNPKIP